MGTVFLHVGTMKSGTTFLQRALDRNANALADQGLAWHGARDTNQAAQALIGGGLLLPGSEGAWRQLAKKVRQTSGNTVVSAELMGPASKAQRERVKRSLTPHDLHLVVTLRDVTKVVPSHWQESTQNRQQVGWDEYCRRICEPDPDEEPARFWRHHDVVDLIRRWSSIMPQESMTVITVRSGADPNLLWSRFASVIGVKDGQQLTIPGPKNTSLGAVSAEVMMKVNALTSDLDWVHYRRGVKSPLGKGVLAARAGTEPRYSLAAEQHHHLRRHVLTMIEEIEASDVNVVGDLAEVIPSEDPVVGAFGPEDVTDAQLLEAALDGLSGLARKFGDQWLEREELLARQLDDREELARARQRIAELEQRPLRSQARRSVRRAPGLARVRQALRRR